MILPTQTRLTRNVAQRGMRGLGDCSCDGVSLFQLFAYGLGGYFLWKAFQKGRNS
jgi:hypothetical protein